jgi:hypothetical protein
LPIGPLADKSLFRGKKPLSGQSGVKEGEKKKKSFLSSNLGFAREPTSRRDIIVNRDAIFLGKMTKKRRKS